MDRIPASYRAAREQATLADRSLHGRLVVRGPDRLSWLHGLVTNDVASLSAGGGCYALMLTSQGRMTTDMRVLETGDFALLDVPRGVAERLAARLAMLVIMEDVTIEDASAQLARLSVHGPRAGSVVSRALQLDQAGHDAIAALGEHENRQVGGDVFSGGVLVAASGELGLPGYDLYALGEHIVRLGESLTSAGAMTIDEATWHVLRVEAGQPAFGADLGEETIPLEAGLESRAISFTKGCYVGQEVIVRVRDRGHGRVARRLVGLVADAPLSAGAALAAGEREAGHVTSVAWSPALGRDIALGYVHRDFVEPGSRLVADSGGHAVPVVVTALPFVQGSGSDRPEDQKTT